MNVEPCQGSHRPNNKTANSDHEPAPFCQYTHTHSATDIVIWYLAKDVLYSRFLLVGWFVRSLCLLSVICQKEHKSDFNGNFTQMFRIAKQDVINF